MNLERIGPENRIGPVGTANPFQPTAESTARSYNIDDGFLNVKTSPAANEGEPFYTFQTLPLPKLESLTIPTTTTDSSPSTSTLTSSTLSSFSATTSEVKTASSTPEVVPKLVQQLVTDLEGVRQRVENGNGLLTGQPFLNAFSAIYLSKNVCSVHSFALHNNLN